MNKVKITNKNIKSYNEKFVQFSALSLKVYNKMFNAIMENYSELQIWFCSNCKSININDNKSPRLRTILTHKSTKSIDTTGA